jgi:hypothetical protein
MAIVVAGALAIDARTAQAPTPAAPDLNDHGIFDIYAAGKNLGTEKFDIHVRPEQIEAQGEIHLRIEQGGKTMEVRTSSDLVLDPQLRPLSYTWSQKGSESSQLSIDFRASPVRTRYKTVSGQEDRRDFKLVKDVVVLDDNVLHHYQLAVARYDQTKGGKQTSHAFIPQEALPGMITVEQTGVEPVSVEGTTVNLRHVIVTTELARVDLYLDDQGHLQVVSVPAAQFQAVRKK